MSSDMSQAYLFQVFQPIAGVLPAPLLRAKVVELSNNKTAVDINVIYFFIYNLYIYNNINTIILKRFSVSPNVIKNIKWDFEISS